MKNPGQMIEQLFRYCSLLFLSVACVGHVSLSQNISSVTPASGWQGQTLNLTISGTSLNFVPGTSTMVWLEQNSNIISGQVNSVQSSQISATVNLPSTALTGLYDVNVGENGVSGASLQNGFEVLSALPLLSPPTLLSPANAAILTANPIGFSWTAVPDAASYQYQVSSSPTFSWSEHQGTSTSTATSAALGNNDYYWRVRTRNAAGFYGSWSTVSQFTVQTQTSINSISPNTGYQGQTVPVTISGTNVSFVPGTSTIHFALEMGSNNMQFQVNGQNQLTAPDLEFTGTGNVSIPLSIPTGIYDLLYTDPTSSTYTLEQSFTVLAALPAPAQVTLVSPVGGIQVGSLPVQFDWSDLPDVDRYRIQVSSDAAFSSVVINASSVTQSSYTTNLTDGVYYWRVQARNLSEIWGSWSVTESFSVDGTSFLTGMSPSSGYAGQYSIGVTISGVNLPFTAGTSVVQGLTLDQNSYQLGLNNQSLGASNLGSATLDIPLNASLGYYDLTWEIPPYAPVALQNAFYVSEGNEFSGRVFIDVNQNQVIDAGDIPYSLVMPVAEPGGYFSMVQANGDFSNAVPSGSYTLSLNSLNYVTVSPSEYSFSFAGTGIQYSGYDFLLTPIQGQHDLSITAAATPLRQNRTRPVYMTITNMGAEVESGTVSLTFASGMTVDSASIAGYSVNGNTVSWNYSNLGLTEQLDITVWLHTPLGFSIGQEVDFVAQVTGQGIDQTPSDNVFNLDNQVVGPYDPNFKVVNPEGPIDGQFVSSGNYLSYTVHFQNVGNASAIDVYVLDTISELLDLSSMQFITASHSCAVNILNDRVVEFRFNDINLPDSASNEPGSKGYFSFRIKPVGSWQVNELIENTAYIYFDYNEAIITNTTQSWIPLGISDGHNQSNWTVWPNPSSGQFQVSGKGIYEFIVTDISGRQVDAGIFKDASVFDLSELKHGVYFLRAKSEKNELVEKLIKY